MTMYCFIPYPIILACNHRVWASSIPDRIMLEVELWCKSRSNVYTCNISHFEKITTLKVCRRNGCSKRCHFDEIQCRRWRTFCQNDNISISVYTNVLCFQLSLACVLLVNACPPSAGLVNLDDFVQDCRNSIADALKLRQSCTKPSI